MEFCEVCENMLYIRTEEDGSLVRYCKKCNFSKTESPETGRQAILVSRTNYSEDEMLYTQQQNPYLRFDPTLPRVNDRENPCPNAECPGPKDQPQVLYVKYNPINMLYFYCCDYCGTSWRKN